jgi:predicted dehydrogenase
MSKKLNFAIVGCGRIGARHAGHIKNNGNLVAVCDTVADRVSALAEEYGANAYTSIDDMLQNEPGIDLVAICSPNGLHAEHSIKSLKAGFHVLCEKPMAISVHDCGEMIKTAEDSNRRLMIVKQNRFNPPVEAAKKLLREGSLGKVLSLQLNCFWNRNEDYYKDSWKGTLDMDGGTLYTQFSHFIDLLYWMIGDIRDVEAYGGNFNHQNVTEFDDNGVIILKFYNGAIGTARRCAGCGRLPVRARRSHARRTDIDASFSNSARHLGSYGRIVFCWLWRADGSDVASVPSVCRSDTPDR